MNNVASPKEPLMSKAKHKNLDQRKGDKEITFTKELNSLGYFVIGIIYTVVIVALTAKLLNKSNKSQQLLVNNDNMKEEIIDELHRLSLSNEKNMNSKELQNQLEKFREELIVEVNRMNIKYIDLIEKNKKKQQKLITSLAQDDRSIASVPEQGKAIKYNDVNRKLVQFKHKREFERKQEELGKEKAVLLEKLDLSKSRDQKKWEAFNDKIDFVLYELRQKQRAEELSFKKKQYIVMEE